MHREDPHAAPSPDGAGSVGVSAGDHPPNAPWILPYWIFLLGLDGVVFLAILDSITSYNGHCGTGALQAFVLLGLAGGLFVLVTLTQLGLHRWTGTPFLGRRSWPTRLPIVIGCSLFLAYFVAIPIGIKLFGTPTRIPRPAARPLPVTTNGPAQSSWPPKPGTAPEHRASFP